MNLQSEWIKDLTLQNEMLVKAVEELEIEASERVRCLEDKCRNSAASQYEVSIPLFFEIIKNTHSDITPTLKQKR